MNQAESMQAAQAALDAACANQAEALLAQSKAKAEVSRLEAELQAAKKTRSAADSAYQTASLAVVSAQRGVKAVEADQAAYAGWQAAIDAAAGGTMPERRRFWRPNCSSPLPNRRLRRVPSSGVSNQRVRNAAIGPADNSAIIDAASSLNQLPIVLHDWPTLRAADIRRAARAGQGGIRHRGLPHALNAF